MSLLGTGPFTIDTMKTDWGGQQHRGKSIQGRRNRKAGKAPGLTIICQPIISKKKNVSVLYDEHYLQEFGNLKRPMQIQNL